VIGFNGKADSILLVSQEVTQRFLKKSENRRAEEARIACNAKGEFISVLSHELRNPLQIVVGSIEALQQSALDEWQREQLHNAMSSTRHLLGVLNDVMLAEKASAGKITIHLEPVNVIDLVENAAQQANMAATAKSLRMHCFLDPRLPRDLMLDPLRLHQVLANMLGNAVKFTNEGYICLSAELVEEEAEAEESDGHWVTVRFSCEDTGVGIKDADRKRVFEPFQQIEDGKKHVLPSQYAGFGLGMPLSR
jgi:two-component system, sensor histidine kinase and response regulator